MHGAVGIEAFGVLARDHEVDWRAAARRKAATRARRPDIGVEIKAPSHLARWIEPALRDRRIFVVRHWPEDHAVSRLGGRDRRIRTRGALRFQRRKADGRGGEAELELETAISRAQHVKRRAADLRPDAVAFHDQQMDHYSPPAQQTGIRLERNTRRHRSCRAERCHNVPSPACGGGTGRGHTRANLRKIPLPTPPPQAGEGAGRVRLTRSVSHSRKLLRMSAVRWPAAAIRKPRSVCVVTKRTPFLMKAFWRARSRSPPSPAYLPFALAAAITRSMATTIAGSPNAPGLPMLVRRSLQPTCNTSTPSTAAISSTLARPSTVSIMHTTSVAALSAGTLSASGTGRRSNTGYPAETERLPTGANLQASTARCASAALL